MIEEAIKSEGQLPENNGPEKKGKRGLKNKSRVINLVLVVIIIMSLALFMWAEQNRRDTARRLEQTTTQLREIQEASQNSGEDVANEVLEKVSALIDIPMDPKPTVATITDIGRLKEANPFFESAENGDFLILTENRAVLYDPDRDIVLDVAPFVINKESPVPSDNSKSRTGTRTQNAGSSDDVVEDDTE